MLCALVLGRSSEIIEEKVQLSIRTKSQTLSCCFSLKLAQSYFFPFLFTFVLKTIIYYKKIIHLFLQIVNIFLSIVRKPKRFLFCMFLFVVKWWEIPLEGSLVAGRWRTVIRDFSFRNRGRLFSVWSRTSESLSHIPFDYHHVKSSVVSAGSSSMWKHFHLLSRVVTNLIFYYPQAGLRRFWKIFHSLGSKHSEDWTWTSQ